MVSGWFVSGPISDKTEYPRKFVMIGSDAMLKVGFKPNSTPTKSTCEVKLAPCRLILSLIDVKLLI